MARAWYRPDHTAPRRPSAVHGAGDADRQARDAARETHAVFRLDQEVEMIILTKSLAGGGSDRAAHGREDPVGAETAGGVRGAQRDVDGMRCLVRCSRSMGYARPPARRAF